MDGGLWERVSPACTNSVAEYGRPQDTVYITCRCYCPHHITQQSLNNGVEPNFIVLL